MGQAVNCGGIVKVGVNTGELAAPFGRVVSVNTHLKGLVLSQVTSGPSEWLSPDLSYLLSRGPVCLFTPQQEGKGHSQYVFLQTGCTRGFPRIHCIALLRFVTVLREKYTLIKLLCYPFELTSKQKVLLLCFSLL